ncbi:MAG: YihY family inner membrane protein [Rhodospirillaceae bacterium]|nr:YihY family inner membrane protein [Rhodospirillaceae bacterium]
MVEPAATARLNRRLQTLIRPQSFPRFMLTRMIDDGVTRAAASLSFTTTLALVPALALVLAMMTAFPAFEGVRASVQEAIFANFLPSTSLRMSEQLSGFVAAAGGLTAFGVAGLAATSIALLLTIESAFNRIFRVRRPRPLYMRLLVLWAVITVGPFLIGLSFTLFGTFAMPDDILGERTRAVRDFALGQVAPTVLTWAALTFIYLAVPNRRIRLPDAALGAACAALAFGALRYGFALYVSSMTSYETVYGAVAAVPVFLVWLLVTWIVMLAGAVITATLPEWRFMRVGGALSPLTRIEAALEVIARLAAAQRRGGGLSTEQLGAALSLPDLALAEVLDALKAGRFVTVAEDGHWILSRDTERTALADLLHQFGLGLAFGTATPGGDIGRRLATYVQRAADSERTVLSVSLAKVIGVGAETDGPDKSEGGNAES